MAKLVYALSGQGRGHTSRAIAASEALRRAGHEVVFCCGGRARETLENDGESVIPVPALRQVIQGNRIRLGKTIRENWKNVLSGRRIVTRLTDQLAAHKPDLLITDFEVFSPHAAHRLGVPVLSFNHQQVVTETRYQLPARYWLDAALTRAVINVITPRRPVHVLLTSFFFPPLKNPARVTLIPPIIRPAVQQCASHSGNHVLVYYNHAHDAEHVLETLRQVEASFVVYNFPVSAAPDRFPNLTFKEPSWDGFLHDLATSRAVLCTAGFTLISEALHLGKPLLAVPNRGIFEQTMNALWLEHEGQGRAVLDRPLHPRDVTNFLAQLSTYEAQKQERPDCGNDQAVACIENVLPHRQQPTIALRPSSVSSNGQTTAPRVAGAPE